MYRISVNRRISLEIYVIAEWKRQSSIDKTHLFPFYPYAFLPWNLWIGKDLVIMQNKCQNKALSIYSDNYTNCREIRLEYFC